jgi:hypothetical protein
MLKIEVDAAADEIRISREIERVEPEVATLKTKLANVGPWSAPANIVAQGARRLATRQETRAKKDQLALRRQHPRPESSERTLFKAGAIAGDFPAVATAA